MAVLLNMRPDAEVEPLLGDHLIHLRKLNQRPRSIRERRLTVLRVARYFGHPVADVTREELKDWQTVRMDQIRTAGQHNEVVHISCYLKWLTEDGRRADNPAAALVRPKHVHQRRPRPMPEEDITHALAVADQPVHVWIGLGAFCGLRCVEMASLSREDIIDQGADSYLRIIGKGGKERIVPLPDSLRNELESGPFNRSGFLFSRMDGKPGPPSAMRVSERINDFLHSIGIDLTAHKLRHRYGTIAYATTKDPFQTAEWMGHASTDTTRLYVQLVNGGSGRIANQISQLGSAS